MLKINHLNAKIDNKEILKGFSLSINPGEVHAIMGPNGSGKSTLSNILSGKKGYNVTGEILFEEKDLFELETEERAHKGIFLAFQYPLEIPGVNTNIFLKTSLNAVRKARGEKELLLKPHNLSFLIKYLITYFYQIHWGPLLHAPHLDLYLKKILLKFLYYQF